MWFSWRDPDYFKSIPKKILFLIQHWKKQNRFVPQWNCDALRTHKEVVYRDGKCPVMLQSWSWSKNCNHKCGQRTDCCPHQCVSACPRFRTGRNIALICHRWESSRHLVNQKRAMDVLGCLSTETLPRNELVFSDPHSQTWVDPLITFTIFSSDPQPRTATVEPWSAWALQWSSPQTATAGNFGGCV